VVKDTNHVKRHPVRKPLPEDVKCIW